MSQVLKRAAGDSSFFYLKWTEVVAGVASPVDLSLLTGIVLQWERTALALEELALVIDDGPNGLGHFVPTEAQMIEGQSFLRVKGTVISTGEVKYFPSGRVCLQVEPALKTNT